LTVGVLSFFADFTYEGARSIYGPFLALLAANATIVSIVTGFGVLVGYGFRLVSGRWADRTGNSWPIAIFGYFVQLLAVPALALANNWPTAAALIILERFGRRANITNLYDLIGNDLSVFESYSKHLV